MTDKCNIIFEYGFVHISTYPVFENNKNLQWETKVKKITFSDKGAVENEIFGTAIRVIYND